jgi:imidazole glycerol-phosphate synthase subunit HisH
VLDYGSGNLRSAQRALERAGAVVTVTADHQAAVEADGLMIPGVGAFAACMSGLLDIGGDAIVAERQGRQRPSLAVCVGMQVVFDDGNEHGHHTAGLGVLPGRVERIDAPVLPHMGWNTVTAPPASVLFRDVADERFYFVHSYGVRPTAALADRATVTTSDYGAPFVAAIESGTLSATQFHPEKSGDAGAHLLATWVETL